MIPHQYCYIPTLCWYYKILHPSNKHNVMRFWSGRIIIFNTWMSLSSSIDLKKKLSSWQPPCSLQVTRVLSTSNWDDSYFCHRHHERNSWRTWSFGTEGQLICLWHTQVIPCTKFHCNPSKSVNEVSAMNFHIAVNGTVCPRVHNSATSVLHMSMIRCTKITCNPSTTMKILGAMA